MAKIAKPVTKAKSAGTKLAARGITEKTLKMSNLKGSGKRNPAQFGGAKGDKARGRLGLTKGRFEKNIRAAAGAGLKGAEAESASLSMNTTP